MNFSAFDPINLKSKKVRSFYLLLGFLAVGYSLGYGFYLSRAPTERAMAFEMINDSINFAILAVMLCLFFDNTSMANSSDRDPRREPIKSCVLVLRATAPDLRQ